jgi:acetylornithine deacetylase
VDGFIMGNEQNGYVEEARRGEPVALARWLVSIPSVNPVLEEGGAGESRIATEVAELLESWGLEVVVTDAEPGRPNVVATLAGDGPTLLLNGHLDTVGVAGMTVPPFAASIQDGRLHGRGACDMKAGIAAILAATHALAAAGPRPNLLVALTADEEHASVGMAALVAELDAEGRVFPRPDMAVVCEPTSLNVMPAHKGFVWVRAEFRGRAAHGSRPDVGIDAIRHAGLYLAALDAYADRLSARPEHPLLAHGSFHAGTIRGGSAESVYPDWCELVLERRTLPGDAPEATMSELAEVLDEVRAREPTLDASLEMTLERPGTEVPGDHRLVRGLMDSCAEAGVTAAVQGMTAWVDAAFLNEAGVAAVCFGPGSIEQAHTHDEWVDVDEIRVCADVLERFARSLAPR